MNDRAALPQFVREALDEEGSTPERGADVTEVERTLCALLEAGYAEGGGASSAPSFARLEAAISQPPLRYAPFFARAAELFDLSEEAVALELERLKRPSAWRFAGWPGVHHVPVVGGPRVAAAETLFVRFAPGVYFPKHRHTGIERVLVLEGSYTDTNGLEHRAGELREWAPGTGHAFRVDERQPCVFASVVFGRRFDAWPLRALAKLLGS